MRATLRTMSPAKMRRMEMVRKMQVLRNYSDLCVVSSYILLNINDPAKMGTTNANEIYPV